MTEPPPIPSELEARIRRDLVRGRRIVWLTWVADYALTGRGSYVFASNTVSWSVAMPDGELEYRVDDDGRQVTGTWRGRSVDLFE